MKIDKAFELIDKAGNKSVSDSCALVPINKSCTCSQQLDAMNQLHAAYCPMFRYEGASSVPKKTESGNEPPVKDLTTNRVPTSSRTQIVPTAYKVIFTPTEDGKYTETRIPIQTRCIGFYPPSLRLGATERV